MDTYKWETNDLTFSGVYFPILNLFHTSNNFFFYFTWIHFFHFFFKFLPKIVNNNDKKNVFPLVPKNSCSLNKTFNLSTLYNTEPETTNRNHIFIWSSSISVDWLFLIKRFPVFYTSLTKILYESVKSCRNWQKPFFSASFEV